MLPTPGIAHLTRHLDAHGGVVISASHNPFEDNGIKIFSSTGAKFPDAWEDEIETRLRRPDEAPKPTGAEVGRLRSASPSRLGGRVRGARRAARSPSTSRDLHIVLDCAHGATYRVAPRVFEALGARVTVLGAEPDGQNINLDCGALHPEGAAGARARHRRGSRPRLRRRRRPPHLRGRDRARCATATTRWRSARRHLAAQRTGSAGGVVVTTVMANLGLEHSLREAGIRMVKTQVGDRYVLEEMVRIGANLGGEQSGHLLFLDHATTGDGIVSALQLLAVMRETGQPLSALAACLTKFPQVLVNVPVRRKPPLDSIDGLHGAARRRSRAS